MISYNTRKNFIKGDVVKKSFLALLLGGIVFSGCTPDAPTPTNFVINAEQNKAQAGMHWEIIANNLAQTIVGQVGSKKTIYVNEPFDRSRFNVALHSLLVSALVKEGASVAKFSAAAEVNVDLKTQLVKFSKNREVYSHDQADPKYASGDTPQYELIVTAATTDNNRYLGSVSNVYYVADSDAWLYSSAGKKINLEGSK